MSGSRRSRRRGRPSLFRRDPGQAIVIIALVMIVLLAFVALAIDGGQLYFLQRDAQNAADAAIMASLFELCRDPTRSDAARASAAILAGRKAAAENGFDQLDDGNDLGVGVNPPARSLASKVTVTITVPYNPGTGLSYDNVEVVIIADKPSELIHLVYQGPLQVRARTAGYCKKAHTFEEGKALFGGGECGDKTVEYSGSGATIDGGVGSNGGAYISGPGSSVVPSVAGNPSDCQAGATCGTPVPPPIPYTPMPDIPDWNIANFRPGGEWALAAGTHYYDVSSGTFPARVGGRLPVGIYYSNGNLDIPLDKNSGDSDATTSGMTWVAEGDINVSANAPNKGWTPYQQVDIPVLPLMYSSSGNRDCSTTDKAIKISGSISFKGVIYAPNGLVELSFADTTSSYGAILAWTLNLSGSNFQLHFDPDWFPPARPVVGITG